MESTNDGIEPLRVSQARQSSKRVRVETDQYVREAVDAVIERWELSHDFVLKDLRITSENKTWDSPVRLAEDFKIIPTSFVFRAV
jgi:hypothetical protein